MMMMMISNNNLTVKKKQTRKWFEDENMQQITVKGEKYILKKKRKGQPCHTNWKNPTETQLVGQKKKTPLGLLSYNVKSA